MNDDILIDNTDYQELKNDPVIQEEVLDIIESSNVSENYIKESKYNERSQNNQSDISVYGSNDINNLYSAETFNIESSEYPSSSGNTVINNYIYTISSNLVSDNILTKELKDYSTSESLAVISFLLCFSVIFTVLIRKAVYRWN